VSESNRAIYAALAGNVAIAVTKLATASVSGSSAMLAEGVHSIVDSGNQLLLLFGRRQAARPPDAEHPFGHGQELYFWTLIVAVLIFGVGGGVSLYEGVTHLAHPHPAENVKWSYIVLAAALLFETISFLIGYAQFREEAGGQNLWQAMRTSKDPTTFTVVFEDTAALAGIIIAFLGIWLGEHFHNPAFDGAASIAIGALLMGVSVLLARESKGLLIGEAVDATTLRDVWALARQDPAVESVSRPLTMHLGPDDVLLAMEIQFRGKLPAPEVAAAVDRIEQAISSKYPQIRHVFVEAKSLIARHREEPRRV
jgi:cation diffusion facilitator family transporter